MKQKLVGSLTLGILLACGSGVVVSHAGGTECKKGGCHPIRCIIVDVDEKGKPNERHCDKDGSLQKRYPVGSEYP